MMVFDPHGDGFYVGLGTYYAARQDVYHVHEDFSRSPELFMEAVPLDPLVEEVARIENRLVSRQQKLEAFVELARQNTDDANIHFIVARYGFLLSRCFTYEHHRAYCGATWLNTRAATEGTLATVT